MFAHTFSAVMRSNVISHHRKSSYILQPRQASSNVLASEYFLILLSCKPTTLVSAIDVNHVLHFLTLHFLAVQAVPCTSCIPFFNALGAPLPRALLKFLNVWPYKWQELLPSESCAQAEAFAMEDMKAILGEKTLKRSRQL